MRLKDYAFIFIILLVPAGALATPMDRQLTVVNLTKLPVHELARRLLGTSGDLYNNEVQRSIFGGHPPSRSAVITLASRARSAGFPGICEADTAWVTLWPVATDQSDSSEAAMSVHSLRTSQVFRIVGDASPLPDIWNERYGRKLQSLCASSGSVFRDHDRDDGAAFFQAASAAHASFAARALQKTIEAARSKALIIDRCSEDRGGSLCADPSLHVGRLSPATVGGFDIDACVRDRPQLCVEAFFSYPTGQQGERRGVSIRAVTDASDVDPPPEAVSIRSATIKSYTMVH